MKSQSSRLRSFFRWLNYNQPSYLLLRAYRAYKLYKAQEYLSEHAAPIPGSFQAFADERPLPGSVFTAPSAHSTATSDESVGLPESEKGFRDDREKAQAARIQPSTIKPLRLMVAIFAINTLAIAMTINMVRPQAYSDFELQDVQIQQVDSRDDSVVSGIPARLEIAAADVDIEVASGGYDTENRTWELSNNKAHYADITPQANNKVGNTFIYGHNRREVFASLDRLSIGDQAVVHTANGKIFTYTLRDVVDVEPTDVSLFEYQGTSILTVQTCSGNWFEKRRLYTFDFTEVV